MPGLKPKVNNMVDRKGSQDMNRSYISEIVNIATIT
jgi:hypothetical protein